MSRTQPDIDAILPTPPLHQPPPTPHQAKWVRPDVPLGIPAPSAPAPQVTKYNNAFAASTPTLHPDPYYKPKASRNEFRPYPNVPDEENKPYDDEEYRRFEENRARSRLGHHAYSLSSNNLGVRVGDKVFDNGLKPMERRRGLPGPVIEEKKSSVARWVEKAKAMFGKKK
ncbi:uncharacterized protein PAC_12893 [Phialocephala subalpina]|uniref:Uncharacterized protein n=1 Tax=Phialocephala subalpina TaxID=576137 RepID=A0A1L7XDD2_9HELO|nr:uncharacterized protein PAC_12893 [Phialocephala subalpina]